MDCPDCALTIQKDIAKLPGVIWVNVDFMSGILTAETSNQEALEIERAVKKIGYDARADSGSSLKKAALFVPDMDCPDEEKTIRAALAEMDHIADLQFNLLERKISILYGGAISPVINAIRKHGFDCQVIDPANNKRPATSSSLKSWSVAVSATLIAIGGALYYLDISGLMFKSIILAGAVIGGWRIAYKGIMAGRKLRLDMNFLMSAAVIGAMIIGQWLEAGAVIVLFSLAQLLESYSLDRSRKAIRALMDLSPKTVRIKFEDREATVPIDEINIGDIAIVKPGEQIPVDGRILSGSSLVNQANITGESMPVSKAVGDLVFGGTMNGDGALEIETIHAPGDNTLDKITHLIEEAQSRRAPSQGFVDRFSAIYTPTVVGLALLLAIIPPLIMGADWFEWIYRALTLLVIACPCALVISTPVTIVSALAAAARNGVLIKGGAYIENLHGVKAAAFDKTGTITQGRPTVIDVVPLNQMSESELVRIAASIEKRSQHPIGAALIDYAEKSKIELRNTSDFKAISGRGASGILDGTLVFAGNYSLFEEMGISDETVAARLERMESESRTVILIGTTEKILGLISLADEIRPRSAEAISQLRSNGVGHIAMLTGDNDKTAQAVGLKIKADEIYSALLPEMKVEAIEILKRKYGSVVMVGDGVNDAPALASSTIGIAMGAAGSDVALETADIALMSDDLMKIPWAFRLSGKARRIIIANIVMAIGIKAIFIVLAGLGLATLWMAVFADMGVSLLVILNGLRALRVN